MRSTLSCTLITSLPLSQLAISSFILAIKINIYITDLGALVPPERTERSSRASLFWFPIQLCKEWIHFDPVCAFAILIFPQILISFSPTTTKVSYLITLITIISNLIDSYCLSPSPSDRIISECWLLIHIFNSHYHNNSVPFCTPLSQSDPRTNLCQSIYFTRGDYCELVR